MKKHLFLTKDFKYVMDENKEYVRMFGNTDENFHVYPDIMKGGRFKKYLFSLLYDLQPFTIEDGQVLKTDVQFKELLNSKHRIFVYDSLLNKILRCSILSDRNNCDFVLCNTFKHDRFIVLDFKID